MPIRLGGPSGPTLTLTLEGSEREVSADLTKYSLEPAAGATSLTSNYAGDQETWWIDGSSIQSTDADSLWRLTWDHSGEVADYVLAPHGNDEPTADQPHFTGQLAIGPSAPIGGQASDAEFSFDFSWQCTDRPVLDDGSGDA